jgi:cell wall-associated NlpC family hydrolase
MVFFKGTYRRGISHVGVYVGDGKFIHASTYRTGVKEDSLDAPYYSAHYVGARRP